MPSSSSSRRGTEEGGSSPVPLAPGFPGTAAGVGRRKRERGMRGTYSPPRLGLGTARRGLHGGGRRRAAAAVAAALRGSGGGVRWWGDLVEVESCAEAYL